VQKSIQKLLMITSTILFTLIILGAASAAAYNTTTVLTVNQSSTYVNEPVTLTAHLTGNGHSLAGQNIIFKADNHIIGTGTTDSNGYASYIYTPTSYAQGVDLRADFAGAIIDRNNYLSSFDQKNNALDVNRIPTSLIVNNPRGYNGDTVSITAKLVRQGTNTGIANKLITIMANGRTFTGYTDANGLVTWNFLINNMHAGNYNIKAKFNKDNQYSGNNVTGTLTVDRIPTSLIINSSHGYNGETVSITAKLVKQGTTTGIANKLITILVNGKSFTAYTDANGQVIWNFLISNMDAGNYNIKAKFSEDPQYSVSSGTGTLTVNAIPTSLTVNSASGYKGHSTTLTARLWDTYHNVAVVGKYVDFYVGGIWQGSALTDANGVATWVYNIIQDVGTYPNSIYASFAADNQYTGANGANTLTVNAIPTNLVVDNITGNKGKSVNLKATLTDTAHGNIGVAHKEIFFKVNGVNVGSAYTDANGVAILPYLINLVGGIYNISAEFADDTQYTGATGTGTLKVNQSSIYVLTTVSKKNPIVGEIIRITFKLGNKGPDTADNVVFTYHIPDGMEFVSLETEPGYPAAIYDPATRTITWILGTVPQIDPWLKVNVKVLKAGNINTDPQVNTDTYDPTIDTSVKSITVNAVNVVNAASNTSTIGMQNTGIPIAGLLLAVLAVFAGLIIPKRR